MLIEFYDMNTGFMSGKLYYATSRDGEKEEKMDWGSFLLGVIASLVATLIATLCSKLWRNRKQLKLYGLTKVKPDEDIRMSAAYLFRIKVHGKYLLIKGGRIKSQYQPVGGVYKTFPGADSLLNDLGACPDDSMNSTFTDADDLRIQLPRRNAIRFLEWFDTRKNREISTLREFREELVVPGYLPDRVMETFNPEFIRQCERQLTRSKHLDINEILVHDVYEIRLCEEDQNALVDYASKHPGGELILVDKKDITQKTAVIDGCFFAIAPTAEKVL